MITAVSPETAIPKSNILPSRQRHVVQPPLLPDAASSAPKSHSTGDDDPLATDTTAARDPSPAPARKDSSAIFAAAVIAGALSPRPRTMEELILRIGTSPIPEESEARLKDLIA